MTMTVALRAGDAGLVPDLLSGIVPLDFLSSGNSATLSDVYSHSLFVSLYNKGHLINLRFESPQVVCTLNQLSCGMNSNFSKSRHQFYIFFIYKFSWSQ